MPIGLLDLLTPEMILCHVHATDWRNVVSIAGDLMEKAGLTTSRYTQAMRELIEREGPYLVIAPGIALLHARPEEGVIKPGLIMMTLSDPVEFGHSTNDPVWLVFGLAATTDKSHVQALAELALMLSEPGTIEALQKSKTKDELYEFIQTYVKTHPKNEH